MACNQRRRSHLHAGIATCTVLVLIMTQLVALYAASFNFAGMESRGKSLRVPRQPWACACRQRLAAAAQPRQASHPARMLPAGLGLSLFAAGYLLLMMALLFTRSSEQLPRTAQDHRAARAWLPLGSPAVTAWLLPLLPLLLQMTCPCARRATTCCLSTSA